MPAQDALDLKWAFQSELATVDESMGQKEKWEWTTDCTEPTIEEKSTFTFFKLELTLTITKIPNNKATADFQDPPSKVLNPILKATNPPSESPSGYCTIVGLR